MTADSAFAADYLSTWTEPDEARRHAATGRLWATDGSMSVSSLGTTLTGVAAITAHIDRVHADLIAGKGLRFSYDQELTSGDALLLRWSMTAPDGSVVGRGADVVRRNPADRITEVNMFMGVE
ncbi:nuclear transport factor 2 family protein [Microbacterium gorillae]|uniref:nuclear transport factor 2 family protein n=1 Tax=Microbacterium gorillae TaxID=1231063 RepID=UPI00058F5E6A|nr:nuclear transport factor 2 family protein [Microbacterium gorillae]